MAPTQETLFSLELLIDYVRFDRSRGNVLDPAVGVRLLDFPTLLIYKSGREDPSKAGYADLRGLPEALSQPDDLKYPFQKGKSCLFKINLDSLHTHLLNTPLYAMVLDVKDEIPRLIGSSLISLAKVTERIKLDVDKHGINTPTAHGERLSSPICNLMGKGIGVISLSYKIVSLGAHLIPHIPDNRVYEVGVTPICERVHGEKDDDVPPEVPEIHNVLSQQISLDGQPTDIVISEAKQPAVPAYTQTEQAVQSVSWSEDAQEYTAFCPPPMFYCSNEKNQQERKRLQAAMGSLNLEDPEDGNNEEESSSSDMLEIPEVDKLSKLPSTPKSQRIETDSAPLVDVIRQLPLLNALLVELSQLNIQTPHQQPLSIHPNLAWLYTPETVGKPKTSPKQSKGRIKRGIKSVKNAKTDEKELQPKRKLKYGLTNTFRLRLKLAKSSPARQHECIEYRDVKQDQQKKQRFSDVHKPVRRTLDEAVETVMSRLEINPRPRAKKSHHVSKCSLIDRDKEVDIPKSDQHSVSSNINNPGFQSNKEDSRPSSRPQLSNNDEYQDDFTSLDTTDGYSPDPFSSPKHSGSSNSERSKALPVPAKAENSPQHSLKSTQIIRPRLQTSALSVSSEDSEDDFVSCKPQSQSSGRNTPSVRRTFGKSQSFDSDSAEKGMTFGRLSEDSDLPTNKPVLKSILLSEEQDKLGSMELDGNYHHISELVINKLPGYTL